MQALVVEDKQGIRDIVVDLFHRRGHDVVAFADAESAWEWAADRPFELAVLDWGLPGMDGLELCRRLRAKPDGERPVILVLTGRAEPEDLDEVVAAGADDYIAKPFKLDVLEIRIAFSERQVPVHVAQADAQAALRTSERTHRELSFASQRQADQLRLLSQIRATISTERQLSVVFRTAVDATADILRYSFTSLYMIDGGRLRLRHQVGYNDPETLFETIEFGQGIAGTVAQTGVPVLLNNARERPDFLAANDEVVNEICVPLRDDGRVVGIFNIESAADMPLTEDDFKLVQGVAELVSAAICHTRLDAEARDSERLLRSVLDSVNEVVFRIAESGHILFLNRAWETITGFTVEASIGRHALEFHEQEGRANLESDLRSLADRDIDELRGDYRLVTATGTVRWIEARATLADDGEVGTIVGTLIDITERKQMEDALRESQSRFRHLAMHDPLTGIANRSLFMERLEHALSRDDAQSDRVAVLFVDLDGFKLVNDRFGHATGDRLLQDVARRLEQCVRPIDTIARLGGDEFAVLLINVRDVTVPAEVAERMIRALRPPFALHGQQVTVAASIGIAGHDGSGGKATELLRNADTALYAAKADGRGVSSVYEPLMSERVLARYRQEQELRRAIDTDEICLVYQPAFDLHTGAIVGIEALVRWRHPELGLLAPDDFIEMAENSGLIVPLGRVVLRQACRDARHWMEAAGTTIPTISINLSERQIQEPTLVAEVESVLIDYDLSPSMLEFEIVENALHLESTSLVATLHELRSLGTHVAIDDFGTGFASLNALSDLPVTAVKIDRRFLAGWGRDRPGSAILHAIVALAQSLDLTVTAEGIETVQQLAHVRSIGIERGQGFYFTKPLPADSIGHLILDRSPLTAELLVMR